ncbi:MAG: hypothetical protein LW854_22260 [Rubrivivax sp.]|jgi:hypothetical protein|nr:hypothetical protein [Rubrivivax sp.]
MSDAMSGSAVLAGNPAAAPAAGNEGGQGAASPTPAPAPAPGAWYDGIEDGDLKGYVQNKGWKDPVELANGYRNLEKLLGSEKIPMPKGAEDKDGWSRVYDALGRPKSADDYGLQLPEGGNGDFLKAAAGKFHELGLSKAQAAELANWYNEQATGQVGAAQQAQAAKVEQDIQALKGEWGQAWEENVELGRRAARQFGLDQGKLEALENAFGTAEMLKFMSRIGRGLTEHTFESGRSTNSFGLTPEAARQRISSLREDRDWSAKYLGGNADAKAELQRLMEVAYGGQ